MNTRFRLIGTLAVSTCIVLAMAGPPAWSADPDVLAQGLLAHWPLSGDGRDQSGHMRHAAVHGGVDFEAKDPDGKPGTARALRTEEIRQLTKLPEP